jgi:hypothetical protein
MRLQFYRIEERSKSRGGGGECCSQCAVINGMCGEPSTTTSYIVIFAGNLGDLEESSPTLGRPPCTELYAQAIQVAEREYGNRHVYPYLYSAGA